MLEQGIVNKYSDENETLQQSCFSGCEYDFVAEKPTGKKFAEIIWTNVAKIERESGWLGRWNQSIAIEWREKEFLSGIYKDAYDDHFIQMNIGRQLLLCIIAPSISISIPSGPRAVGVIGATMETPKYWNATAITQEAIQKFKPSSTLMQLIRNHMIKPDEIILKILHQMEMMCPDAGSKKQDIETLISEQIENMLTDWAKRFSISGEPPVITSDQRFSAEICSDIIDRLELDVYNPTPVLDRLFWELLEFISHPREREWGRIVFENSKVKFLLKKDAFKTPDIRNITKDLWVSL